MITTEFGNITEDMDYQHAESERYGPKYRGTVLLDSNRIAVYEPAKRRLLAIVDTYEEANGLDIDKLSKAKFYEEWNRYKKEVRKKPKEPKEVIVKSKVLDDLESFFK